MAPLRGSYFASVEAASTSPVSPSPVDADVAGHRSKRDFQIGLAAILCIALGASMLMQNVGWAQMSFFGLTRAMSTGTAQIDPYHWESKDKSYIDGHFYSVKAPGLSAFVLPAYVGLRAVHFQSRHGGRPVTGMVGPQAGSHGKPVAVKGDWHRNWTIIWALTLFGCMLPFALLLLLVRAMAERYGPGTGTATAVAVGLGSMLLPFSTQLMSHSLSTFALFASFWILHRERQGVGTLKLVALGGLVSGLAVTVEYPLAFGGFVLGLYTAFRSADGRWDLLAVLKRGLTFAGGVLVGVLPIALYNLWAFGSPTKMSYSAAVAVEGLTGHQEIGLNSHGFFGIGVPKFENLVHLLLSPRGLLITTPVLAMGLFGAVIMYRKGHRAEGATIIGMVALHLLYNAGYWLPFGGGTPGPRFLIPTIPFVGIGLVFAWKKLPSTTLVLAVASGVMMGLITVTYPLVGFDWVYRWWSRVENAYFVPTVWSEIGLGRAWPSILPTLGLFALAALLAAAVTRGLRFAKDWRPALAVLAGWGLLAGVASRHIREDARPADSFHVNIPHRLVGVAGLAALVALGAALAFQRSRSVDSEGTLSE
ncbi:unannotated protein [freshwater metagenome]|uniref:Unannotated protein n=1 Tax=freshwater metagenome TaxID=449393 RepID=A0A6J7EBE0_9ZZZZ